jgi:nitroreductase
MGSMGEYKARVAATRRELGLHPEREDLLRFASLAASGHNTQPWLFRLEDKQIVILPNLLRRTPVVDPDDHHLFVSLGCAAENLQIAGAARGLAGEMRFEAADGGAIRYAFSAGRPQEDALFAAIPKRQSTRNEYSGRAVSGSDRETLRRAGTRGNVDLVLLTDRAQMESVLELVLSGNQAQMRDPAFVTELKAWLRFSPRDAWEQGDGLFSASSGLPPLPSWLGPRMFDMAFGIEAENKKYAQQIRSSAGLAVFVGAKSDPEHWVAVGQACQRFALQATALGIKCAYVNQAVEEASLRPELASLLSLPGRRPDLVVRFGYSDDLPYSARRPVSDLLA